MEVSVKKLENGAVDLMLGDKGTTFMPGADVESICVGVEHLIKMSVGVSAFDLVKMVLQEFDGNSDG